MEYKEKSNGGCECSSCNSCDDHKEFTPKKKPSKGPSKKCENRVVIKIDNSCFECDKKR